MKYRRLGRSGIMVSEIGVGGHHLRQGPKENREFSATPQERSELFSHALDRGINFFDSTFREEVQSFGDALRLMMGRRSEMVICSMDELFIKEHQFKTPEDCKSHTARMVDTCLEWLSTDCIDVFWLRCDGQDAPHLTGDMLRSSIDALRSAKEEGKIRAIGNTGHDTKFMRRTLGEWDVWDVVMFPYNFVCRWAEDYFLPTAREHDVGVVIMKPFFAGRFFRTEPKAGFRSDEVLPQEVQSQVAQAALKWILRRPEVSTVIPAMNEIRHVDDAVAASGAPLTPEEGELLEGIYRKLTF